GGHGVNWKLVSREASCRVHALAGKPQHPHLLLLPALFKPEATQDEMLCGLSLLLKPDCHINCLGDQSPNKTYLLDTRNAVASKQQCKRKRPSSETCSSSSPCVVISMLSNDNPLKRILTALSYRIGATLAAGMIPGLDALYDIAIPIAVIWYWFTFFRDAIRPAERSEHTVRDVGPELQRLLLGQRP